MADAELSAERSGRRVFAALGVVLLASALATHAFPATYDEDPWPLGNYLASLRPWLFFGAGLCLAAAVVLLRLPRGRSVQVALAFAVGFAVSAPALVTAWEAGSAWEARWQLQRVRERVEAAAAPKPVAPPAPVVATRSSLRRCEDPGAACPNGESCFVTRRDGLTVVGGYSCQGGDHRCHRRCPCADGERCRTVLTYESDTPSRYANLCFAGEPEQRETCERF